MNHATSLEPASRRIRAVGQARQAVLAVGLEADLSGIQPWLARSWQRCLGNGFNPKTKIEFEAVGQSQCRAVLDNNQHLVGAAQPAIARLARMVSGLGYFALLTDSRGIVVHVDGAIDRSDPATALARVGVDLSEQAIGTSAICTALIERHAVWLHQGEHFYEETSVFSCAGAPVFGPRAELLGMLDLTGVRAREQSQLKNLVSQVAKQIEHSLLFECSPYHCVIELSWPLGGFGAAQGSDALGYIRVDREAQITGASAAARNLFHELELLGDQCVMLSDLFATPDSEILEAFGKKMWQKTVPLWSGLNVQLKRVDTIQVPLAGNFSAPGFAVKQPEAVPIKEMESALIMKAVNDTRGNVNEAARRLGLSRATVYRKLANRKKP
jgi:sigma-54 dependent transcriptional regulator, acetoin dehydrogenase operon transcriptional activator AcoR